MYLNHTYIQITSNIQRHKWLLISVFLAACIRFLIQVVNLTKVKSDGKQIKVTLKIN